MQCPNCKKELKEGNLYCEYCGYEIQMVPDFEPEVDAKILSSLKDIQKEMNIASKEEEKNESFLFKLKQYGKEHRIIFYGFVAFCVSFFGAVVFGVITLILYLSPNYQYGKAMEAYEIKNYSECLRYVERTVYLDESYKDAYLMGFQSALILENYVGAENYLKSGMLQEAYDENEIMYCYDELIQRYIDEKQYQKINDLLIFCPISIIVSKYQEYLALPVKFSYAEGTYANTIPLKLSAAENGTIYYTVDGTKPTKESEQYKSPIFLDEGEYVVNAVFINDFGVESEAVTKTFFIENRTTPYPPAVSVYSGEYVIPQMISVEASEDCIVYYTTDGSIPDETSQKYTEEIPMPLGKSQFKFICYSTKSGFPSEVVSREYALNLNTEYAFTNAQRDVYAFRINQNVILDYSGTCSDYSGFNSYEFQYAISIKDKGEFYLIAEFHTPADAEKYMTGLMFAVNVYDGTIYTIAKDENMNYVFTLCEM